MSNTSFRSIIEGKQSTLELDIDINHGLLRKMQDYKVITETHRIAIQGKPSHKQVGELLDILCERDDELMPALYKALTEVGQPHIARMFGYEAGESRPQAQGERRDNQAAASETRHGRRGDLVQSTESSEVFISYQHKKQPQVEALLGKLEDLGYRCWMDKKMMGVGDKLDAEIAGAIEGCQLVLSCVTPEYVASEYCWLEVSYARALNKPKPILPLLLEKMEDWPRSSGRMSLSFTGLIYLNCYMPSTDIQDKWDCPQFDDLTSAIDKHIRQQKT